MLKPGQLRAVIACLVAVIVVAFAAGMRFQRHFVGPVSTPGQGNHTGGSLNSFRAGFLAGISEEPIVERVKDPDRVYIHKSLAEIRQSVAGMTQLQSDAFEADVYKGKWIRVRGKIAGVNGPGPLSNATIVYQGDESGTVRFGLANSETEKAKLLSKGDVVVVEGVFGSMDGMGPDFINAVIIDP